MSKETRLLRASLPFLAFGLLFVEGIGQALGLLGMAGMVVLAAAWPAPAPVLQEARADRPRAPPVLRPPARR